MDSDRKNTVLKDVRDYLDPQTEKWYADLRIPWRRGYLLYGDPGTGKTSSCVALAGELFLPLYVITLSDPKLHDAKLEALFSRLESRCIVLLEDVDSAGIVCGPPKVHKVLRKDKKGQATHHERAGVTLAGLLNVIDGPTAKDGRIRIMTSNTPDSLDEALVRRGRVDDKIYFGNATSVVAADIFQRIYTKPPEELEALRTQARELEAQARDLTSRASRLRTRAQALEDEAKVANENQSLGIQKFEAKEKSKDETKLEINPETPPEGMTKEGLKAMAAEFASILPENKLSPAEIQGFLLDHRPNPKEALKGAKAWSEATVATKSAGKTVPATQDTDQEAGNAVL